MDYKTRIIYALLKSRLKTIDTYASRAEEIQDRQLRRILSSAAYTSTGIRYGFSRIS